MATPFRKGVAVVIPAKDEEAHIAGVVQRTIKQGFTPVVVDDGSDDRTEELAEKAGAITLRHVVNLGKGAGAKTGCDWAVKQGAEAVVLMDADGQHRPEDIKRLLAALRGVDIVFGYRKRDKRMPSLMRFGNWLLNAASEAVNGIALKDTQSGFRAMTASTYKKVRWQSNDYGMESEMIAKAAKKRLKYRQIPIDTIYHDKFKGTTVFDGVKITIRLLKWKML
ncbi:glycosyltransferase family 2 protein [Candidatus Woesearchaeota archaeon]|nr:glycosyltransferase family 2 protein [Candidatus Woesearchaeota archaeon]